MGTPIEYSFRYELKKDKNENLTGLVDVIIAAECQGVKLFDWVLSAFNGRLMPHMKEKSKAASSLCQEELTFLHNGINYKNQDCSMHLEFGERNQEILRKTIILAIEELEQKYKDQQNAQKNG